MVLRVHMKAPSGTGSQTLCGKDCQGGALTEHWREVDCPTCLVTPQQDRGPPKNGAPTPLKSNNHYDVGGISAIDVIHAKLTFEQYQGFLLGNIVKYALRLNWKDTPAKNASKLAEYSKWLDEQLNSKEKHP